MKKLILRYGERFIPSEERSLFDKIKNHIEYSYEDFLKDIDDDFWEAQIGHIFDEENLKCFVFINKDSVDFDENFCNSFILLFQCLDSDDAWQLSLIEVDKEGEETQIDIVNWYMADIVKTALKGKDREKALKKLRNNFSKKLN